MVAQWLERSFETWASSFNPGVGQNPSRTKPPRTKPPRTKPLWDETPLGQNPLRTEPPSFYETVLYIIMLCHFRFKHGHIYCYCIFIGANCDYSETRLEVSFIVAWTLAISM